MHHQARPWTVLIGLLSLACGPAPAVSSSASTTSSTASTGDTESGDDETGTGSDDDWEPEGECEAVQQWTEGCCALPRPCPKAMESPEGVVANPDAVACIFDALAGGEDMRVSVALFRSGLGVVTHDYYRVDDVIVLYEHGWLDFSEVAGVSVCEVGDPAAWSACSEVDDPLLAYECVTQGLFCTDGQYLGTCGVNDDSGCHELVGVECPPQEPGDCEQVSQWHGGCCELPSPCPTIARACTDDFCDEPEVVEDPAAVACVFEALAANEPIRFWVTSPNSLEATSKEYWHVDGQLLSHLTGFLDLTMYDSWQRCLLADAPTLADCAVVQDPLEARACVDLFCSTSGASTNLGACDGELGPACPLLAGLECPTP